MQPYHFVLFLFAVCLAHAFYRVRITLKVEKFLEYRAALFLYFIEQTEETIKCMTGLGKAFGDASKSVANLSGAMARVRKTGKGGS